jgi:16S rRNA (guanine966-N2)-methyltransferase
MRIIAGTKRGMTLLGPKTQVTRPITDRVKQSLFDVLQNYGLLAEARVADLFCGVGSLGLEALSRGAAFVTFVEKSGEVLEFLNRNVAKAGFAEKSRVVRASVFRVGAPTSGRDRHDLVFVDPPYASMQEVGGGSPLADLLHILEDQVADRGIVVVRTHRSVALLDDYGRLHVADRRRWGTMAVVLLQAAADEQQVGGD